jgi:hypothetical protein
MPKRPAISTLADNPPARKGAKDQFDWSDTETGTLRPADCFSKSHYPLSLETILRLSLGEDT